MVLKIRDDPGGRRDVVILADGVRVSYAQFYAMDRWSEQPLFDEAFHGQTNGLCGAQTRRSLFLITGLHTGRVPVEVQILDAEPRLESDWEEAVEVSVQLTGSELVVVGWAGESEHTVPLPTAGTYRVRYCASGMDAGRSQDVTIDHEQPPDRYRLQCWPAPPSQDTILRHTSEIARYWHTNVRTKPPPTDRNTPGPPLPAPHTTKFVNRAAPRQQHTDTETGTATASYDAGPEPPSWVALLTLMVHGPDPEPTLRGAIRSWPGEGPRAQEFAWVSFVNQPPVLTGVGPSVDERKATVQPIRVWRDGNRLRIEKPDATVHLIVGDSTCWQFDGDHNTPLASPSGAVRNVGNGTQLLSRPSLNKLIGDDPTHPLGPVGSATFLGRPAWTVELAPRPGKPHPLQFVVDAETGIVLQQRNDVVGAVNEWVEFIVGDTLDPTLFTWDGPARSAADERAEYEAQQEAIFARRRQWFTQHVTSRPLRVELNLGVLVDEYDDATGAFQASLESSNNQIGMTGLIGLIARRPRAEGPWDLAWYDVQHRWSTPRWDWALSYIDEEPTAHSVEALKQQLVDEN